VWVPETRFGVAAGWWQDRWVVISCLYWLFRHLLALIVLRCRSEAANEVEILVLRHELGCCDGRLDARTAGRLDRIRRREVLGGLIHQYKASA
jgi:hypothetical protein